MHRGMPYPVARAATNVALRSLGTALVMEEMYRGTPVIYIDYTDYDEIAHHSGPERGETLDALDGVDLQVESLVEGRPRMRRDRTSSSCCPTMARASARPSCSATARASQDVISDLMGGVTRSRTARAASSSGAPLNAALSEAAQAEGTTAAITRVAFKGQTEDGAIDVVPAEERAGETADGRAAGAGRVRLRQPRAHLLPAAARAGCTLEQIEATWPGMVETPDAATRASAC